MSIHSHILSQQKIRKLKAILDSLDEKNSALLNILSSHKIQIYW